MNKFKTIRQKAQRHKGEKKVNSVPNKIGFTLLEVLISLAIVGLTLTVLIHSQLLSIRQATKAKYHTTAIFLANEILSDTFMQENQLMRIEGKDFEDYPEFSWEREVEDSDVEGLKEIKITVSGP
jgi:type II secretion system protein I